FRSHGAIQGSPAYASGQRNVADLAQQSAGERAQRADGALRQGEQVLVPNGRSHLITVLQTASAINVGQVANLRGGWLPPPVRCERGGPLWVGPIDNRPQLSKPPHKVSTCL